MNTPRQLLHGLLEYIQESVKEVNPKGFRLSTSTGFLRRRGDIAGLPGVEFDVKVEGDHIWLRVARLEAINPPPIPEDKKGLVLASSNPSSQPPILHETGILHRLSKLGEGKSQAQQAEIDAQLRASLNEFLKSYAAQWQSWAEGEKPRRRTIALYGDLFALKHQLEAEETAKPQELVWGVGIASWQIPFGTDGVPFEYPLLTQALEISLDEKTMAIEVRPRATDTRIEMDALVGCSVMGAAEVEVTAKEHLQKHKDRPVTPFDPSSYTDVLKLAASNLDSHGSYREVLGKEDAVPAPGPHLVVTDAWVLLSRPRSNNYLTDDLKRLQEQLEKGCELPLGPLSLVTPPSDEPVQYEAIRFRGLSSRGSGSGKAEELYFPLPYNEEQVTIVQRLEHAPGVTVQGPPGTGKTHTIGNIICHYLATGRRVLVTSKGEPALEVLQSKIPEEVRALTVALLASDREGVRQFQASIEAIQHQVSQLNPEQTRRDIATLQAAIDRAHNELTTIDKRVDEIAVAQLSEVEIDGIPLRAQKLAELVVSGKEQHGWFDDAVGLSPENAPPLFEEEAGLLREARRTLGADLIYAHARIPSPDDLPPTAAVATLQDVLSRMRGIEAQVERGELLDLKANTPETLGLARELLNILDEAFALAEELDGFDDGWPLELRAKCRQSSFATEREALESLFADIEALIDARAGFLKRPVEFPERGLTCQKTREAVARAVETGKPFGFIAFGAAEAKENIGAIRVSGLPPATTDDWQHVSHYVALHEQVVSFLTRWNQFAEELSVPRLEGGVSTLRKVELVATAAKKAHHLATHFDALLPQKAQQVFSKPPAKALVGSAAEMASVRDHLVAHLTRAELSQAAVQLTALQEKLVGKSGPIVDALWRFVRQELGNPELAQERVAANYANLVAELRRIAGLGVELSRVRDFAQRLEKAGAPKLAARVRSQAVAASGEDNAFPPTWREAWNWARIRQHLEKIEARSELLTLFARRRDLEGGLARLYKEMVAKAAWLSTKHNATPKVLQALAGYAAAIRRIGQGTGPNATRYRRDAREAMLDAAGAVPCWIMSHARISEAMPAEIGAFDLVIVDEASQSDLWALPAILRGKKILVVGDDKQVSPDGGFKSSQRIEELKARFLSEQPYRNDMTPEKSLYDLASRVFAAHQVMLREHFRCVPPIIAYSNRVFYQGGVQPLRIPKASERIDPPLVDIYVPGGMRSKHDCNEQEAQAIAGEIGEIMRNPDLQGRTIGVVSLLGMDQAKRIDEVVRARCDAGELMRRKFECGDARTFQGSERDIVFLSLVVDSQNCKAVSGNMFDQRFNVAASRARDRMYLVRSVKASDLSDKDLRLSLLAHFEKPLLGDGTDAENLIDRCESGFEREVFSMLVERGYRTIPQVKTGAYRIDMVVEGAGDVRLAIELDGDEYHGPDRWEHDMNRQRVLERAGWVFWRCFASTWALRKDEVFAELVQRLTTMGIEPLGALERAPSLVDKRVWMPQPKGEEEEQEDPVESAMEEAIRQAKSGPVPANPSTVAGTGLSPLQAALAQFGPTDVFILAPAHPLAGSWVAKAFSADRVLSAWLEIGHTTPPAYDSLEDIKQAIVNEAESIIEVLNKEGVAPVQEASCNRSGLASVLVKARLKDTDWRVVPLPSPQEQPQA